MSIMSLNQENFSDNISKTSPVLVDFWAAWCGPCHMLSPVVEELSQDHPEITIATIPTLLLFRDGELVDTSVGVKSKAELENFLA